MTTKKPPKTGAGLCACGRWPESMLGPAGRVAVSRVPSGGGSRLSSAVLWRGPRLSRVCVPGRPRSLGGGWEGPLGLQQLLPDLGFQLVGFQLLVPWQLMQLVAATGMCVPDLPVAVLPLWQLAQLVATVKPL